MAGYGQSAEASKDEASIHGLLGHVFGCSNELASTIYSHGRLRDYAVKTTIVRRGDRIATLYVVVAGLAHAIVYSFDGQAVLLHEYRRGDFFGATGTLHQPAHESDIVTVRDVCAFLLDGGVLAMLAERHGCIGLALLQLMVERLQRTSSRMYEHAALSAVGRVHAELLRLARERDDLAIRPAPVLSELALRVSTTRETVSRAVNALERRGIIRRDSDALVVVAPHRLEELVL